MILISLLGNDLSLLIPIIHEYKNQISHHIVIHDDALDDIRRAIQLKNGLERFCYTNGYTWQTSFYRLDEDSKNDIMQLYSTIKEKHIGKIVLHSSEGFASLAFILSSLVVDDGGEVITFDPNDNEINHLTKTKIQSNLDINSYLTMLNFKIMDIQRSHDMFSGKKHVQSLFSDYNRFLNVRNALVSKKKNFDFESHRDLLNLLHAMHVVDDMHDLIPSQQQYLQGGLFEEHIFWIVHELGFDDIALGVKIDFEQLPNEMCNNRVMNEFDILITHNNRMYTIECKMVTKLDGLGFVYKYDAIIDIFGIGSKAIILNISPQEMVPYLDTNVSSNFHPSSVRRGKLKDIEVYHDSKINTSKLSSFVHEFFKNEEMK
jgi:hypothetical protein